VDIDTLTVPNEDVPDEPPPPYASQAIPLGAERTGEYVKPTVEADKDMSDVDEEYMVTETISRTETRIRKSLSRKPSGVEGKRVVKSEDEEPIEILSQVHTPISPSRECKRPESPLRIKFNEPLEQASPDRFEGTPRNIRVNHEEMKDVKPTTITARQNLTHEEAPTLFQRDSPMKTREYSSNTVVAPSQPTPSSTLPPEDKKLVELYLRGSSRLVELEASIEERLKTSEKIFNSFLETSGLPPLAVRNERLSILEQKKSLSTLVPLHGQHRALTLRKDELKQRIIQAFDAQESEALISQQHADLQVILEGLRDIEIQIGQLLRVAGATESTFSVDVKVQSTPHIHDMMSANAPEGQTFMPRPSGSSNIGNTQIVFQTQVSTKRSNSVFDANEGQVKDAPSLYSVMTNGRKLQLIITSKKDFLHLCDNHWLPWRITRTRHPDEYGLPLEVSGTYLGVHHRGRVWISMKNFLTTSTISKTKY
jgi:hypothetical protein